jgi:hypothetical protein
MPITSSNRCRCIPRLISRFERQHSDAQQASTLELDSHADTSCAGKACRILEYTNKTCTVNSFSDQLQQLHEIPIVKAATAYDAPNGEVYIIILNQALYLGEHMEHSLLCPNQARSNGVIVNDVPKHLAPTVTDTTHSIVFQEDEVILPLELQGIISKLTIRTPTTDEVENCRWLILTNEAEWDHNDPLFMEKEHAIHLQKEAPLPDRNIFAFTSLDCEYDPFHHDEFYQSILAMCKISYTTTCQILSAMTSNKHFTITAHDLAEKWDIGLTSAEQTLKVTTQRGIQNAIHRIHRCYRTKQAQLKYNQLGGGRHGRFYTDTFFSSVKSTRQNQMAQIFANDSGYVRVFPMKLKSEAPSALLEFVQDVGVPHHIHSDNAKNFNMAGGNN